MESQASYSPVFSLLAVNPNGQLRGFQNHTSPNPASSLKIFAKLFQSARLARLEKQSIFSLDSVNLVKKYKKFPDNSASHLNLVLREVWK
jgi:hypothetical protein